MTSLSPTRSVIFYEREYRIPFKSGKIHGEVSIFDKNGEFSKKILSDDGLVLKGEFGSVGYCAVTESDARILAAALADYFFVPTRITFKERASRDDTLTFTPDNIITLSGDNEARIHRVKGQNRDYYVIKVYDTNGVGSQRYRDANPRWSNGPEPSVYSYTM